jgi:transposase
MSMHRKKYTKEFKIKAVRLVTKEGYRNLDAAQSLGIRSDLVSRWRWEQTAQEDADFTGYGQLSPEQKRIRDLEKQVNRLQMEKEY